MVLKRCLAVLVFLCLVGLKTSSSFEEEFPPTTWHCMTSPPYTGYCFPLPPNHPDGDIGIMCFKNIPPNPMPCHGSIGFF